MRAWLGPRMISSNPCPLSVSLSAVAESRFFVTNFWFRVEGAHESMMVRAPLDPSEVPTHYLLVLSRTSSDFLRSQTMLLVHCHRFQSHLSPRPPLFASSHCHPPPAPPLIRFSSTRMMAVGAAGLQSRLTELPEEAAPPQAAEEAGGGPIEIPSSSPSNLFAVDDNPTPLQTATSVLLTAAISVFLFRALRRRAKRAKELRVRSTGVQKAKGLKEEALDSLKQMGAAPLEAGAPPSPVQALLGGIAAGVIAVILYKFTTTIEAALNRQAISDNFSVRQITITVRTIVNGLCYLATFVFGINSISLILYSIQLTFSSIMGNLGDNLTSGTKDEGQLNNVGPDKNSSNNSEVRSDEMQGGPDGS